MVKGHYESECMSFQFLRPPARFVRVGLVRGVSAVRFLPGAGGPVFSALTGSHDTDLPPAVISFKAEQLFVPAPPLLLQEQPFFFRQNFHLPESSFESVPVRIHSGIIPHLRC